MINQEEFYEKNLKGKTKEQIMSTIRGLKQEIGHRKNMIENLTYIEEPIMSPSEDVCIHLTREYLKKAKQAFAQTGGTYTLSKREQKAIDFNENIEAICKIIFTIGGLSYFHKIYVAELSNNFKVYTKSWENIETINLLDNENPFTINSFLSQLIDLHIGEWRKSYSPNQGIIVNDGTQWELEFEYNNGHKSLRFAGDNTYPYNFKKFKMLFGIDDTVKDKDE